MKRGIDVDRIDPEFLMELSDPIEAVYEVIEHDLLVQLAKRFDGSRVPKSKVPVSTAWRAYMLEQIGGLTEDNIRLIAAYSGDVSELTQLAVRLAVETAIGAVEPELAKMVRRPEYVPSRSATAQRMIESYAAQALNQLNLVNTVMLNSSLRAYEQTQQQRYMEHKVRRLKTQADALAAAGDAEGGKALRGMARQATVELMNWCRANGRDFYPERVRVLKAGEAKTSANTLKNSIRNDILVAEAPIRTVGAASPKKPNVENPETGLPLKYVSGRRPIYPNDHTMAGYGCKTGRQIDEIDDLAGFYNTPDSERWQKEKARYWVYDQYGEERQVELHWYQHPDIGKVEHKIKTKGGRIYVDEWDD